MGCFCFHLWLLYLYGYRLRVFYWIGTLLGELSRLLKTLRAFGFSPVFLTCWVFQSDIFHRFSNSKNWKWDFIKYFPLLFFSFPTWTMSEMSLSSEKEKDSKWQTVKYTLEIYGEIMLLCLLVRTFLILYCVL